MTILLTGASGYLGQHVLLALLSAGHDVTALVRDPARLGKLAHHSNVRVRVGDLTNKDCLFAAVQSNAVVLHTALIWGAEGTEFDLPDSIAAAKLFDTAGRAGVRRCVLVSSTAVHRPFRPIMNEASPLQTTDLYGASKASAELMMWAACHTHGMTGLVVRSGPIVGPPAIADGPFRSDRTLQYLVRAAKAGEPLKVVENTGRQFVGTSTIAGILATMVDSPQAEGTYLCVDRTVTLWEQIAEQVVEIARSESRIEVAPATSTAPPARFIVDRLEALLGQPLHSKEALAHHIHHLVQHY